MFPLSGQLLCRRILSVWQRFGGRDFANLVFA
jgi:hypothetical protein